MTGENNPRKRIVSKIGDNTEVSIEFEGNDLSLVVDAYFDLVSVAEILEHVKDFREQSTDNGNGLFIPNDSSLNQMKKLCLSAAASYPKTLTSAFIETQLGIPFNSYKVYATAREHDSHGYLEIDSEKGISILSAGFSWLKEIL